MADLSDEELLAALDLETTPEKPKARNPREERIIAGFHDIQRFVNERGRTPRHGENHDIFEQLYAVRLDKLRSMEECRVLLEPLDWQRLLTESQPEFVETDTQSDEALLAALGVKDASGGLTELRHVRSSSERKAAEEIAQREACPDFEKFKNLFQQVQLDLDRKLRNTCPVGVRAEIQLGKFFILGGQKAYVAEMGQFFRQEYGDKDARLRVVFDNGTQSSLLLRSFQRALNKDEASRRITDLSPGPLFTSDVEVGDKESGTIYVLRSKSDLPIVAENRDLLHKVGVTGGSVERRIANAKLEATFLLAEVEIVMTYKLLNINRTKLENLLHRVFEPARLDIEINDRFGNPVTPKEWFLLPLFVINDAVEKIKDGTINQFYYDPNQASFVRRKNNLS